MLSVVSTQYAVTITRLDLDLRSELVAHFFKFLDIALSPERSECALKRWSLVYVDGSSQEPKDVRIQFCHCSSKVGSCQRRRQPVQEVHVRLQLVRHVQNGFAPDQQRCHLVRLRDGSLSILALGSWA